MWAINCVLIREGYAPYELTADDLSSRIKMEYKFGSAHQVAEIANDLWARLVAMIGLVVFTAYPKSPHPVVEALYNVGEGILESWLPKDGKFNEAKFIKFIVPPFGCYHPATAGAAQVPDQSKCLALMTSAKSSFPMLFPA